MADMTDMERANLEELFEGFNFEQYTGGYEEDLQREIEEDARAREKEEEDARAISQQSAEVTQDVESSVEEDKPVPLTPSEQKVYNLLIKAGIEKAPVLISAQTIEQETGVSYSTVLRALKKMQYLRYIYHVTCFGNASVYSLKFTRYVQGQGMSVILYK